jgi:ATP-dependent DNA ligase
MTQTSLLPLKVLSAHGEALSAKAVELDIEGIVAKRMDAQYAPGAQLAWLKIKNPATRARQRLHSGPGEARRANESSRPS